MALVAIGISQASFGAKPPVEAVLAATATPGPLPTGSIDSLADSLARVADPAGRLSAPAYVLAPNPDSLTGYVWPVPKARLTQSFGPSDAGTLIVDGQTFHDGIDLASWCGGPVRAAHDGVVLTSGRFFDPFVGHRGNLAAYNARLTARHKWLDLPIVIVTDDGNGYRSIYAHFLRVTVHEGDVVKAGQIIGAEGATGHASGCHLHYGLFSPAERSSFEMDPATADRLLLPHKVVARIDPLRVLPSLEEGGIRLLP